MLYYLYITGCKSRFCSRFTGMLYTILLASRAIRTAASSTKVLVNLNSNLNWLRHPSLAYGSIKMKCNTKTLLRPRPVIPSYFCQGATRLPAVACPGFKQAGGTSHEARNNACCVARLGTWDMAAPAFIKAGLLADFWRSAMVCQVVFQLLSRKMLCMQMIRRELIGGKAHHWYQQLAALLEKIQVKSHESCVKAKPLETLRTPTNTPSEFDSNSGNIGARHRAERKLLSQKLKYRPKPCKPKRKVSS